MADTTYQTVNGPKTTAQMYQELQNAGWGGPPAGTLGAGSIANAYAQTTGGAVNEMAGQSYGAQQQNQTLAQFGLPSGGSSTTSTQVTNPTTSTDNSLAALQAFAAQTSGVTDKQLAQQKAEFDAQLQFARDQMTQLGIPQLQINQFIAQLQQRQFESQLALAAQAQAVNQASTEAQLTGWYTSPGQVPSVQQWLTPQTLGSTGTGTTGTSGINLSQYEGQYIRSSDNPIGTQYLVRGGVPYAMPNAQAATALIGAANYAASKYPQATVNIPNAQLAAMAGTVTDQGQLIAPTPAPSTAATPAATPATPDTTASGAPATTGQAVPTLAAIQQNALLSGWYNGMPTETAREFNANLALQQGQLGQQYLATAAQLQGPQNTFQLSNYLRGAQGNPAVPTYLQSLANNSGLAAFQGQGNTAPTPQSAAGLLGQLGGGSSATPGWDYAQTLGAIQNIANRGAQGLAPGALERLTPDELSAFGSGLGAAGYSLPSFLQQYAQSRVGQSAAGTPTLA